MLPPGRNQAVSHGIGHVRSDDRDVGSRAFSGQNGWSTMCHNHADVEPCKVVRPSAQGLQRSDVLVFYEAFLLEPFAASFREAQ
jgi:hypothetical protein